MQVWVNKSWPLSQHHCWNIISGFRRTRGILSTQLFLATYNVCSKVANRWTKGRGNTSVQSSARTRFRPWNHQSLGVTLCATKFDIQELHILPTVCIYVIYVFWMNMTTNGNCFLILHQQIASYNSEEACLLSGTIWLLICSPGSWSLKRRIWPTCILNLLLPSYLTDKTAFRTLDCSGCVYVFNINFTNTGDLSGTVVKVLCYKSEGRWWITASVIAFFIEIKSLRSHYGPGVDSASNINEHQEYFLGKRRPVRKADNLTTILCRCHVIWEP